jgi:hypothetical protein
MISGADSQGIPSYLGTTRNIGLLLAAKSGTDRRLADQATWIEPFVEVQAILLLASLERSKIWRVKEKDLVIPFASAAPTMTTLIKREPAAIDWCVGANDYMVHYEESLIPTAFKEGQ